MHRFTVATRFPAFPAPGEVHVWAIDLAADPGDEAANLLSADERIRTCRFAFDRDRRRFIRSRVALRCLLAGYLGGRPGAVEIGIDSQGKPFVRGSEIAFNLSHAGETALVAVCGAPAVGVDIEERKGGDALRDLGGAVLSPKEHEAFERISDDDYPGQFLALWTRKEAVLKALGTGLLRDPRTLTVGAEGPRRIAEAGLPVVEVATIVNDDAHVAALAVTGGFDRVRRLHWPSPAAPATQESVPVAAAVL